MHGIDEYLRDRYGNEYEEDLTDEEMKMLSIQYGENWKEILNIRSFRENQNV